MVLITKLFIIQNFIVDFIIYNISDVMVKIIYKWNVIILLMNYKNICYKFWQVLRIVLF